MSHVLQLCSPITVAMEGQLALSFVSRDEEEPTYIGPAVPPQQITHRGLLWYLVDHQANRGKGSKRSEVWDIGDQYIAVNDPSRWAWRCQLCGDNNVLIILTKTSTAAALRHVQFKHPGRIVSAANDEATSDIAITERTDGSLGYQSSIKTTVNIDKFRYHLLRWIVNKQVPFDEVEDEDFRKMLLSLSPTVDRYLVQSSQTIRNWAEAEYLTARLQVKQVLSQAKSRIHISFDLWTSPNGYSICGICAHFVSQNLRNTAALLGMKRMKGQHSGENIAGVIIPVLIEYEVTPRLGVFIADNAGDNDTAIRVILAQLRPDLSIDSRRARCLGHIINLAAKAFLFGSDIEAFEEAVEKVTDDTPVDSKTMRDAQVAWRKKGVIGRFHNLTVFIRATPQRREAFKRCVVGDSEIDSELSSSSDNGS